MDSDFRTPGQLIEHLLAEAGWTKRTLAIVLDMDETGLNKLIAGKRSLGADVALMLGELFGIDPQRFLDLQTRFDLAKAAIMARPDPGRSTRARLFGGLPIADMIKRGWLKADDIRNVPVVEAALAEFFGVTHISDIEILPHAAKKTNVSQDVTPTQLAWLYRVKQIAAEMLVGRYSPISARGAVRKLNELLLAPEEARRVPKILAESGIRFLIVESLPSAKIDGVTFWLGDLTPVIGITLRYDRMDNFWFVLRHELEHVIRGHGRSAIMLDAELEGERASSGASVPEEERLANEAAAEFCVPQDKLTRFIDRKAPFFPERDLLGFARTLQIHPALVAGQLQHRTGRYDRFRQHQAKIRSFVAPSAVVDGWGDIAPVGT